MKTSCFGAIVVTTCWLSIPGAAWAKGPGRNHVPDAHHDRQTTGAHHSEQRSGKTHFENASPRRPVHGGAVSPSFAGSSLPPCPVAMALVAPFNQNCTIETRLARHQNLRVEYVGSWGANSNHYWSPPDWSPPVSDSFQPASDRLSYPSTGLLRLLVDPPTALAYVDGYYVGPVGVFDLKVGPHRIEVKAPDYNTLKFDVHVDPNQTITYQGDLQPAPYKPLVEPGRLPARKTFYVIPGCYAGDRPPQLATLPQGCDLARLRTLGSQW